MKKKKTLRELRVENRYTIKQLSELTGIPFSSLTAYEYGYRTVPLERALVLAKFYGVDVNDIKFIGAKIKSKEE